MARIRVPVIHDGESYKVDLPNFIMVPASWAGGPAEIHHVDGVHPHITPEEAMAHPLTCEVIVPERYVNEDGTLNAEEVDKDRPENILKAMAPPEPE